MIRTLGGRSVLLVEGDPFVAGYVGRALTSAGARVIGPAHGVGDAQAILAAGPGIDASVVAITGRTVDEWMFPEELARQGVPVAITIPASLEMPQHLCAVPCVRKPFAAFQLVEVVTELLSPRLAR